MPRRKAGKWLVYKVVKLCIVALYNILSCMITVCVLLNSILLTLMTLIYGPGGGGGGKNFVSYRKKVLSGDGKKLRISPIKRKPVPSAHRPPLGFKISFVTFYCQ